MGTDTVRAAEEPPPVRGHGRAVVDWLTTTDHKRVGHL